MYGYTQPDRFIQLFYDIGFVGIKQDESIQFRSLGPQATTPPPISTTTSVVVHPSYAEALNLQNTVIGNLDESIPFRKDGIVIELPDAINLNEYNDRLTTLIEGLKNLPHGDTTAKQFEDIVGEAIKLCFFRSLTNIEPRVRNYNGRVIRDWIAANHAPSGFWEMIRQKYKATQIVWECKNYGILGAEDFQQASYYMNEQIGFFGVVVFRGEIKNHYNEHIQRISNQKEGGIVLLITEKDLNVFLRQAIKGKAREQHIQEIYDKIVRAVS
jgi:hypothetical protein